MMYVLFYRMAADISDGNLTAVVICEGNYDDPTFPNKLNDLVSKLNNLIEQQPKSRLKVNKVSMHFESIHFFYGCLWVLLWE